MPRYYFDVSDGDQLTLDQSGTDLANEVVARDEATRTLSEIAAEEIPGNGPERDFRIVVRDDHRAMLFELRLTFHASSS